MRNGHDPNFLGGLTGGLNALFMAVVVRCLNPVLEALKGLGARALQGRVPSLIPDPFGRPAFIVMSISSNCVSIKRI